MEANYHDVTTHRKKTKCPREHFACLEVCCYGIDLGASIERFYQSEQRKSTISTIENAPLCNQAQFASSELHVQHQSVRGPLELGGDPLPFLL